jgi:hypothetical protein
MTLIALLGLSLPASALLIGFEELHPGYEASEIAIPDGYMGFDWSADFMGMTSEYMPSYGYGAGATGGMLAYTWYQKPVSFSLSNGTLFDFIGADITSKVYENDPVIVEGLRFGAVVYSEEITTSPDKPYSFVFDFLGVDAVRITPVQGASDHHLAIDQILVAPEPATMLLLAAGFFLQLPIRKRLTSHHC